MSYFNDDQKNYIKSLQYLKDNDLLCDCGWYSKKECHCSEEDRRFKKLYNEGKIQEFYKRRNIDG